MKKNVTRVTERACLNLYYYDKYLFNFNETELISLHLISWGVQDPD